MTIKKIEMINKTLEEAREDLEETQELNGCLIYVCMYV